MKVEQHRVGTVDVLTPNGALVDDDMEPFRKALIDHVNAANPRLTLAFQDVPYMDSAAIETLLDATDILADRAIHLKLANVTPTCREILEVTGVSSRFRFFADVEDAVRSFL